MEDTNRDQRQGTCNCGNRHVGIFILRWMLGIVILLTVFWMGVQIGSVRSLGGGGHYGQAGYGMRSGYLPSRGMPMMRYGAVPVQQNVNAVQPAAGSATTTTPVKK
jgi:hypothetical protein